MAICAGARLKIICAGTQKPGEIQAKKHYEGEFMVLNLIIDDEQSEVLTTLADHEDQTAEEYASDMLNNLLATIWRDLQEEFLS